MPLGKWRTPWLYASHTARHAEGRGYGREDRDGGLNDEAPYLSFLFIHDFFFSFKGLTNEVFSLISLTMLGHAKKTTDTTFTIFYNQVCFVHSISSMSLG